MENLWGREPAIVLGLIEAGLALALTFGLSLSLEQTGAIMAFAAVLIAVITRSQVTPVGKLPEVVVGVQTEDGEVKPSVLKAEVEGPKPRIIDNRGARRSPRVERQE